jgi:hypothetical protein
VHHAFIDGRQGLLFFADFDSDSREQDVQAMHDAHTAPAGDSTRRTLIAIAALLAAYAATAFAGWPQHGRDLIVQAQATHEKAHADAGRPATEHGHADDEHAHAGTSPPPLTVLPFVLLLAAIAILPLTSRLSHWWEHNSSKLLVAGGLGLVTLAFYTFLHRHPLDIHFPAHAVAAPAASGPNWGLGSAVLVNALLAEYVPFITLLFALYVITGGVRIEGDLVATPTVNTLFIATGGLLASFVGSLAGDHHLLSALLSEENKVLGHDQLTAILPAMFNHVENSG